MKQSRLFLRPEGSYHVGVLFVGDPGEDDYIYEGRFSAASVRFSSHQVSSGSSRIQRIRLADEGHHHVTALRMRSIQLPYGSVVIDDINYADQQALPEMLRPYIILGSDFSEENKKLAFNVADFFLRKPDLLSTSRRRKTKIERTVSKPVTSRQLPSPLKASERNSKFEESLKDLEDNGHPEWYDFHEYGYNDCMCMGYCLESFKNASWRSKTVGFFLILAILYQLYSVRSQRFEMIP